MIMRTIHRHIHWEVRNNIGILGLDNPPGNYLETPEFIPVNLLKQLIGGDDVKALLITGTGKHFSGGASREHLISMTQMEGKMIEIMENGKTLLQYFENLHIPVVAAIKGICFGGGLEIALACHIRICTTNALFAFPESNHNILPGLGGIYRLREQSSFFTTLRMVLGGDMIDANEALQMKVVDRIVGNNELMVYSLNLLEKMTAGRPLKVIRYVMQALRNSSELSFTEAMKEETRMFCELAREEAEKRMKNEHEE